MVRVEIVTTGDEVMQGVIVDTNTSWLSDRCAALGHEVVRHTAVGDDAAAIGAAITSAAAHAECVIITGGLGPTSDDITLSAAAKAFGKRMIRDEAVIASIRAFFERVGRPMSASNEQQAFRPEGSAVLQNRVGTAPGIRVRLGDAECFFLPGVPKEMTQIFDDSVHPWLAQRASGGHAVRVLRCFGIPEASIDERLRGVDLLGTRLSFRVKFPEILLKVVARGSTEEEAGQLAEAAIANVRAPLGDVAYGEGEGSLAEVVGWTLSSRRQTVAVAESCTGGLLASLITDVPGSSEWFERGAVTYSNESKQRILGVRPETLAAHGAVSREVVEEMAEGVRRISGTDFGIAITGIAGPSGGTPEKPVGTVHIGIADGHRVDAHAFHFQRDRISFKQLVAWTALDLLRKRLTD